MSIPRITREQFSAAIEKGVSTALDRGVIDFSQAAELRRFGREHVGLVCTGAYYDEYHGCGCPLWETGLHRPAVRIGGRTITRLHPNSFGSRIGSAFTTAYDVSVWRTVNLDEDDGVVEVVA